MKMTRTGFYNLGRSDKNSEKLFMSGNDIAESYQRGSYTKLSNTQKAKLRKIARRILFK